MFTISCAPAISPRIIIIAFASLLGVLLCNVPGVVHAELRATVRLGTGELRIWNEGTESLNLTAYQVRSPSENLKVDRWLPIAGRLDGSETGDMSFDEQEWTVIAPAMPFSPASDELVEGVVVGEGGTLASFDRIYLGGVWDVSSSRSLDVQVASDAAALASIPVVYLPTGDYNEDGVVDTIDYVGWRIQFGRTGSDLLTDGNADGVVDFADYTLWRDNLGATALPAEPALPLQVTVFSIPEPAGMRIIALLALFVGAVWRMR